MSARIVRRLVLGVLVVAGGCSTRDHTNPLDPGNPTTAGHPHWLVPLADDEAVDLEWDVPYFQDVESVRVVSADTESTLWSGGSGTGWYRHRGLANGTRFSYRLELDLSGGGRTELPTVAATPGPAIPWAYDLGSAGILRLTPDALHVRLRVFDTATSAVVADPADASVLVVDFFSGEILLLDRDGEMRWSVGGLERPTAALRTPDGWWVGDPGAGTVALYSAAGAVLYADSTTTFPVGLAPADSAGTIWVADSAGRVVRMVRGAGVTASLPFGSPFAVAEAGDGGVWVADDATARITRLDPAGNPAAEAGGFPRVEDLAADPISEGVWVADRVGARVVLLDGGGAVAFSRPGFPAPSSLSVSPDGGEIWVADPALGTVVRLARNGTELARTRGLGSAISVSVAFDPAP